MVLWKVSSYPCSFSMQEPEFRIALQGGYDSARITFRGEPGYPPSVTELTKDQLMQAVSRAKMKMSKGGFGVAPRPYWVARF